MYNQIFRSPNFGYPKGSHGRQGQAIIGVGVHISGAEWTSNYNWIMNPAANASYNAMIKRDGSIVQFVPESNAAYSHGRINRSTWPLLKTGVNPNLYTLSVSRVGSNQNLWDAPQMESTVKLILHWAKQYNFEPRWPFVFGHKHIDSVGRWYCPGDPFLNELYKQLEAATKPEPTWPTYPVPTITRTIGVEVDGKRTGEVGYLTNNATYNRTSYVVGLCNTVLKNAGLPPIKVTGHGDHIKITTGGR